MDAEKYKGYPGDVTAPIDLLVAEESVAAMGAYGDIVNFPEVDGKAQRDSRGFTIHPEQEFRLVRPK